MNTWLEPAYPTLTCSEMLGQEAVPAREQWQSVRWGNLPTGRQSVPEKPWCSADTAWWLSVGTGPPPQPSTVPILPHLWCSCALKLTLSCQKQRFCVPCQPSAPALPSLHPCLPFHSLLLQYWSFISFKEKLYNLALSNEVWLVFHSALEQTHQPSCWTRHTADTSQLPVSHASQWLLLCRPGWFAALPFCSVTDNLHGSNCSPSQLRARTGSCGSSSRAGPGNAAGRRGARGSEKSMRSLELTLQAELTAEGVKSERSWALVPRVWIRSSCRESLKLWPYSSALSWACVPLPACAAGGQAGSKDKLSSVSVLFLQTNKTTKPNLLK